MRYLHNIDSIDLSKLRADMHDYQNQWIAVAEDNTIAASGTTYRETVDKVQGRRDVILFKVPPLNVSLAPSVR